MKRLPRLPPKLPALTAPPPLVAFAAHPDDIEFACGGVIVGETARGRAAHLVVCSRGEAGSFGTPAVRTAEAEAGAAMLGATVEFIELDGDAHLEIRVAHAIKLAAIIRRIRPGIVLAPSYVENQHPDHPKLARLVRDAARIARYGGVKELKAQKPHAIDQLLFYAANAQAEPPGVTPLLYDVSRPPIRAAWLRAMEAHASQTANREYVRMQLTRAGLRGLEAGVEHAIALFPSDPLVIDSLEQVSKGARRF
jgi:LmbE family N-acetylglucosaminyl deacetylase